MSPTPPILSPKPRRPVHLDSPAESSSTSSPLTSPKILQGALSPTQSILNLSSSTLLGIYGHSEQDLEPDYVLTADTPGNFDFDSPSYRAAIKSNRPARRPLALGLRIVLLFVSGMSYGLLLKHLHDEKSSGSPLDKSRWQLSDDWAYLIFWGVLGVMVGSFLPFMDSLVSDKNCSAPGGFNSKMRAESRRLESEALDQDWTPIIRSIGAIVGVAFGIRKIAWSSTIQASSALSLVNIALWYLTDRSSLGLVVSAAIGMTGTFFLVLFNPTMIPYPALLNLPQKDCATRYCTETDGLIFNWISREIPEVSIWILSVLFCSCVCFGNIGRRLALSRRPIIEG